MRTFDLAPLYRSTVGFDRLFSMLDGFDASTPGYPPYNIERTGENDYRISIAVAGFGENELTIESKENTLTVKGEKKLKDEETERRGALSGHRGPRLRTRPSNSPTTSWSRARTSRTACCTSTSCARSPRRRSRARSPSMAKPSRRWSRPRWLPDQPTAQLRAERPGVSGALFILRDLVRQRAGVDLAFRHRRSGSRRRGRCGWLLAPSLDLTGRRSGLSGRLWLRQRRRSGALHGRRPCRRGLFGRRNGARREAVGWRRQQTVLAALLAHDHRRLGGRRRPILPSLRHGGAGSARRHVRNRRRRTRHRTVVLVNDRRRGPDVALRRQPPCARTGRDARRPERRPRPVTPTRSRRCARRR